MCKNSTWQYQTAKTPEPPDKNQNNKNKWKDKGNAIYGIILKISNNNVQA